MAHFLIDIRSEMTVRTTCRITLTDSTARVAKPVSCAKKHHIAGAERVADATVRASSLGQLLEKHCYGVCITIGASIAAEVEA
jgi:hypothetical protein